MHQTLSWITVVILIAIFQVQGCAPKSATNEQVPREQVASTTKIPFEIISTSADGVREVKYTVAQTVPRVQIVTEQLADGSFVTKEVTSYETLASSDRVSVPRGVDIDSFLQGAAVKLKSASNSPQRMSSGGAEGIRPNDATFISPISQPSR